MNSIPHRSSRLLSLAIVFLSALLLSLTSGTLFLQKSPTFAADSSTSVDVAVDVAPAIAITASDTLTIPVAPSGAGTTASSNLTIDVSTNNLTGYTLTMSNKTATTALIHATTPSNTIPSTTAPLTTPATLPTNTWGYWPWEDTRSTDPTTFSRIPPQGTDDSIRQTTAPATTSYSTLTFAATVDLTVPIGSYTDTVVLTAVGNYVPPPAPTDPGTTLGSLQTLTNASCPTTRGTAFDARNNQIYYVEKIAGLCWMETNLRYAGGGNWDSAWGYPDDRDNLTLRASGTTTYTSAEYIDPGGSTDYTNTAADGGFYGYLYNWCAAMGGQQNACNSTSTSGLDTTTSICPAGWRLPNGYSFQSLNDTINGGSTTSDAGLRSNFLAVYSGYYLSSLNDQGTDGYYWTSMVVSPTLAYGLLFNSTYIVPGTTLNYFNKNYGYTVRCVL